MKNYSDDINHDNYFGIDEDTNYRVKIAVHHSFRHPLYFHYSSLDEQKDEFYLIFHEVAFFESAFQMERNVIFKLATEEMTQQFCKTIVMPKLSETYTYSMFYSDFSNTPIRIVARSARLTTDVHSTIKSAQESQPK